MKQVILSAILLMGILAQADALPVTRTYQSKISKLVLDPQLQKAFGEISEVYGGRIVLDFNKKIATLILNRKSTCPPGKFCTAVMPAPIVITLPIVPVKHETKDEENCGIKIITATDVIDEPFIPEVATTITVLDNRRNICPTLQALSPTEIHLEYVYQDHSNSTVQQISTYSVMYGEALVPVQIDN
jgi:hypothetical protein